VPGLALACKAAGGGVHHGRLRLQRRIGLADQLEQINIQVEPARRDEIDQGD
jgi:hypothetical protein